MAEEKTNVMRMLEQAGVPYRPHGYAHVFSFVLINIGLQRYSMP